VRMNRVLDQPGVPAWFVNFVLFHELIHAALPATVQAHGREFRAWERAHPDYRAAIDWQRANLDRLIRSARTGSVLR
jgi:predicted metal-dependent hydrolase